MNGVTRNRNEQGRQNREERQAGRVETSILYLED